MREQRPDARQREPIEKYPPNELSTLAGQIDIPNKSISINNGSVMAERTTRHVTDGTLITHPHHIYTKTTNYSNCPKHHN